MTRQCFPSFQWRGVVLDYAGLAYNPCDDLIFPSVVRSDGLVGAPGPLLMYYAPHNAPAGICLAVADRPEGPWREVPGNPLIARDWPPHHAVSHVCSPHAVWNHEENCLFLYYHGENSTTRYATTRDGVNFTYGGIVVTDADLDCKTGAFYARVFRHRLPGLDNAWIMLLMGHLEDRAALFLAWSKDGREWTTRREPVLVPEPPLAHLCAPWFCERDGQYFIVCHADTPIGGMRFEVTTDIVAFSTDADFRQITYAEHLLHREDAGADNLRVSDPCFLADGGKLWLYHTVGTRLNQRIALAVAAD
jgi:hypothetical protein